MVMVEKKGEQENDNWLSDNNTTGATMWSQLMRELFSTRNNESDKEQLKNQNINYHLF